MNTTPSTRQVAEAIWRRKLAYDGVDPSYSSAPAAQPAAQPAIATAANAAEMLNAIGMQDVKEADLNALGLQLGEDGTIYTEAGEPIPVGDLNKFLAPRVKDLSDQSAAYQEAVDLGMEGQIAQQMKEFYQANPDGNTEFSFPTVKELLATPEAKAHYVNASAIEARLKEEGYRTKMLGHVGKGDLQAANVERQKLQTSSVLRRGNPEEIAELTDIDGRNMIDMNNVNAKGVEGMFAQAAGADFTEEELKNTKYQDFDESEGLAAEGKYLMENAADETDSARIQAYAEQKLDIAKNQLRVGRVKDYAKTVEELDTLRLELAENAGSQRFLDAVNRSFGKTEAMKSGLADLNSAVVTRLGQSAGMDILGKDYDVANSSYNYGPEIPSDQYPRAALMRQSAINAKVPFFPNKDMFNGEEVPQAVKERWQTFDKRSPHHEEAIKAQEEVKAARAAGKSMWPVADPKLIESMDLITAEKHQAAVESGEMVPYDDSKPDGAQIPLAQKIRNDFSQSRMDSTKGPMSDIPDNRSEAEKSKVKSLGDASLAIARQREDNELTRKDYESQLTLQGIANGEGEGDHRVLAETARAMSSKIIQKQTGLQSAANAAKARGDLAGAAALSAKAKAFSAYTTANISSGAWAPKASDALKISKGRIKSMGDRAPVGTGDYAGVANAAKGVYDKEVRAFPLNKALAKNLEKFDAFSDPTKEEDFKQLMADSGIDEAKMQEFTAASQAEMGVVPPVLFDDNAVAAPGTLAVNTAVAPGTEGSPSPTAEAPPGSPEAPATAPAAAPPADPAAPATPATPPTAATTETPAADQKPPNPYMVEPVAPGVSSTMEAPGMAPQSPDVGKPDPAAPGGRWNPINWGRPDPGAEPRTPQPGLGPAVVGHATDVDPTGSVPIGSQVQPPVSANGESISPTGAAPTPAPAPSSGSLNVSDTATMQAQQGDEGFNAAAPAPTAGVQPTSGPMAPIKPLQTIEQRTGLDTAHKSQVSGLMQPGGATYTTPSGGQVSTVPSGRPRGIYVDGVLQSPKSPPQAVPSGQIPNRATGARPMGELYGQVKGNRVTIGQEETSWVRPPESYMPKTSSLSLASVRNLILPGTNMKTAGKPYIYDDGTRDEFGGRGVFSQNKRVQREKMIDKYVQGGPNSTWLGRTLREHFGGGSYMRAIGDVGDGITYGKSRWAGGERGEAMKAFGGAAARGVGEVANLALNASMIIPGVGAVGWAGRGGLAAIRMAVRAGGKSALGAAGRKGLTSSATSAARGQASARLAQKNLVAPGGAATAETSAAAVRAGIKSTVKGVPANPANIAPVAPGGKLTTRGSASSALPAQAQAAPARISKKDQWLARDKKIQRRFLYGGLAAATPNYITKNTFGSGANSYGWKQNSRTSMGTGEKNPYLH